MLIIEAGEEMSKMEAAKKRAVEVEDYDLANMIKMDLEQLRSALLHKMQVDGLTFIDGEIRFAEVKKI